MGLLQRQPKAERDAVVVQPRQSAERLFEATQVDGLVDLVCLLCRKTLAYGVAPERVENDARFFLELPAPLCCHGRVF